VKCKKEVKKKDHQVVISTLNRATKPDDHAYFHFLCWVDFFKESVNNKSRAEVERMRGMAVKMMNNPMIHSVLKQIGGEGMLQSMLGTPLIKPDVIIIKNNARRIGKNEIAKKIDDDRKKRAGKTKRRSK
jgi:hypothetical protein